MLSPYRFTVQSKISKVIETVSVVKLILGQNLRDSGKFVACSLVISPSFLPTGTL